MSKYINAMIDEARESTENEEYDDVVGLSEEEIEKFFNRGLNRLHSKIVAQHPQVFMDNYTESVTNGQEAYSIPSHKSYLKNKISAVEFSSDSSTDNFYPLTPIVLRMRDTGSTGDPINYIRRNGELLLSPVPSSSNGSIRVEYVTKAKQLYKRRGSIDAVTTLNSQITSLEISYVNGSSVDSAALSKQTRFSVVDKYGNIKMENVLLSAITSSASYDATLEVDSSFTFDSGETITTSDFIVPGAYSSSHLELGPEVERYLQYYVEYEILKRDSSSDSQEAFQVLAEIESDIIASYADISDDIMQIPDISDDDTWW